MENNAITPEMADEEIIKWLDWKKVGKAKRESNKEAVKTLVDALVEGSLLFDTDTKAFKQPLKFPYGKEVTISELNYQPRLTIKEIHLHTNGVKPSDFVGLILSYAVALTKQNKEVLKGMDSEDYSLTQAIAVFFM